MQIHKMFSVRDTQTELFSNPYYAKTLGEAERNFSSAVNDPNPNNLFGKFPEHFQLWYIGDFDDSTGTIKASEPVCVAKAIQFVPQKQAGSKPVSAQN